MVFLFRQGDVFLFRKIDVVNPVALHTINMIMLLQFAVKSFLASADFEFID